MVVKSVLSSGAVAAVVVSSLFEVAVMVMPHHMIDGVSCAPGVRSGTQCAPLQHVPHGPSHPQQVAEIATYYTSTAAFDPHASLELPWVNAPSGGLFTMS